MSVCLVFWAWLNAQAHSHSIYPYGIPTRPKEKPRFFEPQKTGCAYLRDPRDLREIITPARNQSPSDVCFSVLSQITQRTQIISLTLFFRTARSVVFPWWERSPRRGHGVSVRLLWARSQAGWALIAWGLVRVSFLFKGFFRFLLTTYRAL